MWKKSDSADPSESMAMPNMPINIPNGVTREQAVIGPSISIKGDLKGEEDLLIQGRVDGTIQLSQFDLTVGKNGRVNANIFAKVIRIDGEVQGDLKGEEQVVIRKTGNVKGNINAPRVALEDGCRFKGSIDMDVIPANKDAKQEAVAGNKVNVSVVGKDKEKNVSIPEAHYK